MKKLIFFLLLIPAMCWADSNFVNIVFVPSASTPENAFVYDTFSESSTVLLTAHTGELGASWTLGTGYSYSPRVSGSDDNCLASDSGTSAAYASGVPATAEYDVEADYIYGGAGAVAGITGRHSTDADTFYHLRYSGSDWQLYKFVSGTATLLDSYTQSLTVSQVYNIVLEIRDGTKKGYIDGVERLSSIDNSISSAGRAGVRFSGASTINRLDNFQAINVE